MYERRYRRRGWTHGLPVLLADGLVWFFPKIDFALMAASSGLQIRMAEVFLLARETQHEGDSTAFRIKTARYHSRMASLAIHLLRINYEQTEPQWERLMIFRDLNKIIHFSEQTSALFFDTSEIWMPFLTTAGPDGREVLALN